MAKLGERLTAEQQMKALVMMTGLCPDCADAVRRMLEGMNQTPGDLVRGILWNWIGEWPHGRECPNEALESWRERGKIPVGAEAPKEEVKA